ncbi:c79923af-19f1-4fd3-980d-6d257c4c8055 [Thermothielavioides terrestris]|nr:c79923af-19f1-4fd3-980d-6d257c4c8055 [Thermothielavioides terrestris]
MAFDNRPRFVELRELITGFEAAIRRESTQLGRHHPRTLHLRVAFVHLILKMLRDSKEKEERLGEDEVEEIMRISHSQLREIYGCCFTGDALERFVPSLDDDTTDDKEKLDHLVPDYSFLKTFVTACAKPPSLVVVRM